MNILLQGIVGSVAYGLARDGSDVDRLGVFAAPTVEVAGLDWSPRRETAVYKGGQPLTFSRPVGLPHEPDGDVTYHEVGKFFRLALKANPTITELLWLPDDLIETAHPLVGEDLRDLRDAFLSERAVRDAYGGYAHSQAEKLRQRGDSFSSDTKKRTAKHARHLLRLLRQGRELLATGALTVRVPDPVDYFAFDDMTPEQMLKVYAREDELFNKTKSNLPPAPNAARVKDYLAVLRREFLE